MIPTIRRAAILWSVVSAAIAAPMLRLENSALVLQIAPGGTPGPQTIQAINIGDGALTPSVSVPADVKWLTASPGTPAPCSMPTGTVPCVPLNFTFNTSTLARGVYTAAVTVSAPNAIDAPQLITVTLQVGIQPTAIDQYIAPGTSVNTQITIDSSGLCFLPRCPADPSTSTQDGGSWLSLNLGAQGTIRFLGTYNIRIAPPANMATGTYTGAVSVASGRDSLNIPVTMHVATQPIAAPSTKQINLRLAQGGPSITYPFLPYISLANTGLGNLAVQDVSASGTGVSAYNYQGLAIVTVDPGSLAPGIYTDGAVTIQCNAVNCPVKVPMRLEILPKGPPVAQYQGVVDNASFSSARPVAPGDIVILRGDQLSQQAPVSADRTPLPTALGGARVLVNNVYAPLFYSSAGQLAFQMPAATPPGQIRVQVERDSQTGNTVTVNVVPRAPGIVAVTNATYDRRDADHPTSPGETLILWAIGLGPTTPSVADGVAAPAGPLAQLPDAPTVSFAGHVLTPSFAGLAPGSVGLYQVIVTLPADLTGIIAAPIAINFPEIQGSQFTLAVKQPVN